MQNNSLKFTRLHYNIHQIKFCKLLKSKLSSLLLVCFADKSNTGNMYKDEDLPVTRTIVFIYLFLYVIGITSTDYVVAIQVGKFYQFFQMLLTNYL